MQAENQASTATSRSSKDTHNDQNHEARSMEAKRTLAESRSQIIRIAAACAGFQHMYVGELEQDDLQQFGQHAHELKNIADELKNIADRFNPQDGSGNRERS